MAPGPSIVWVTLESTRADHTSMDGYARDTTPNLQRIADASRGRSFSECLTHGIWTLSSSASILTGTYPAHHDTNSEGDVLPGELETVPEAFSELGYRTAGLSTNFHASSATGLDRGFDRFAWLCRDTLLDVAGPRTLGKYLLNLRRHSGGFTTDVQKHSTGYVVTDVLKRWVRSLTGGDDPFFLYAHYGDPHRPYYPPLSRQSRYLDEVDVTLEEARSIVMDHHHNLHEIVANGCDLGDHEWAALRAMYDAELAYTDYLVGHLFDYVRDRTDDLVFVVTGDHGELFGEGGMLAHQVVVDDAVTRVPMVTWGADPFLEYGGEMVQHADVAGTLLKSQGHRFRQGQGIDLRRATRKYGLVQRDGERCRKNVAEFQSINPEFDATRYHTGTLNALRSSEYKYLASDDRTELFRLPDETTDVSDENPEVVDEMTDRLEDALDYVGGPVSEDRQPRATYSEAMREQLADLGYLE